MAKYERKLTSNHYRGCNDRLARAIDTMAGLTPDILQEIPSYEWRGCDRVINSRNDDHYNKQKRRLTCDKSNGAANATRNPSSNNTEEDGAAQ